MSDYTEMAVALKSARDYLAAFAEHAPYCLTGMQLGRGYCACGLAGAIGEADRALASAASKARRPEIVCIVGSSRFCDVAAVKAWEYAKQGVLALGMHLLPAWYDAPPDHAAESEGVSATLDELHLRKIDMADRVFVVNVGGYIGDRTRTEIAYAEAHGKPVEYMEADA